MKLKDPAPEALPPDAMTLKQQAVQRVLGRRRQPVFKTLPGPYGDTRVEINAGDPEFTPPTSAAEWADSIIARTPVNATGAVLITIMQAAREGARTAAAATAAATRLSEHDQFMLWTSITSLPGSLPDVDRILTEVRTEWRRLRLQATPPATALIIERDRPTFPSAAGGTRFSPSVPDFMKAEWQR